MCIEGFLADVAFPSDMELFNAGEKPSEHSTHSTESSLGTR